MFAKVLIADPGEFAPHVARACRELEIATVAVRATEERHSAVEAYADEDVVLGSASTAAIIAAAARAGADAVHPGHGVRSADADFAEACWDNGLVFVGPPPEVIARLADKAATRVLMAAAGLPVPASGAEPPTAPPVRHVEVQVLTDVHGNAVHLGVRDRTPRRRRPIGDSPAPMLPAGSAERMGQAALRGVDAVGYVGAGTFEFLVEPDGWFSFLDVDCRIPADHPVATGIAGFDLVREQLRIAQDLPISLRQKDVPRTTATEIRRDALREAVLRAAPHGAAVAGQVINGRPHVAAQDQ
jgi:acetyl-CoA carboxylase biotin carboxylase subunit